jgi:hypothetical protein
MSAITVDIEPEAQCSCGNPLSNVTIAVSQENSFIIPDTMTVLVKCPICQTTQPVPVVPENWDDPPVPLMIKD